MQTAPMQTSPHAFIRFCLDHQVLRFGEFTLKSGRVSPYFFNAGLFNTGSALATLGRFYAGAIAASGAQFDVLFGPAYKGIPLVSATAIALAEVHGRDLPWCFNRKETKDHGEGGVLVGAPLKGRVLIVDDVITAGTAIREVMQIVQAAGAEAAGVIVALDREEKGQSGLSAIQELERDCNIPVYSIASLTLLLGFLREYPAQAGVLARVEAYRDRYGMGS